MRSFFAALCLLLLSACSGPLVIDNTPEKDPNDSGSFLTGRDEGGISLGDLTPKSNGTAGLPVNALIWRASLDVTSVLPIADVDAFGGSILSEWYSLPSRPDEQIKLAIFVLDKELRSDAVRVIVYVRTRDGANWADAGTDVALGLEIEELILTRARELRAASISDSN